MSSFASIIKGRYNILSYAMGLVGGFLIRDEILNPNFELVDLVAHEYALKEVMLDRHHAEVRARIEQLQATQSK